MSTGGNGFTVPLQQLEAAGAASALVAEGVRGVDLAEPVARLGGLLPASRSAVVSAAVATAWAASMTVAADSLARHSAEFGDTVRRYREADTVAADALIAAFRFGPQGG